jgi:hypothetical protein
MPAFAAPAAKFAFAGPSARNVPFCVTDLLLGATILWTAIPETLTDDIYIYEVPLRFVLFYATLASCLLSSVVLGVSRIDPLLWTALFGLFSMAVVGLLNGNDLKFWVIDFSNYSGLLLGLYWANRRPLSDTLNTLYWWTVAVTVLLLLNIVGLVTGIVPQANEGDRIYSFSLFASTLFVSCMFPLWMSISIHGTARNSATRYRSLAVLGIGCVMAASVVSATRSMFLVALIAIVVVMWTQLRGKNAVVVIFFTVAVGFVASVYLFDPNGGAASAIADRLTSTAITEEERYLELEMMFEQLGGSVWIGKGFGSQFESCIGSHLDSLAYAPHVGIFAPLFKGGLPAFGVLIVYPVCAAALRVARLSGSTASLAFGAAIIIFATQSSMSGGWIYSDLLLYGMTVSLMARCDRHLRASPRSSRRMT